MIVSVIMYATERTELSVSPATPATTFTVAVFEIRSVPVAPAPSDVPFVQDVPAEVVGVVPSFVAHKSVVPELGLAKVAVTGLA